MLARSRARGSLQISNVKLVREKSVHAYRGRPATMHWERQSQVRATVDRLTPEPTAQRVLMASSPWVVLLLVLLPKRMDNFSEGSKQPGTTERLG